MLKALDFAIEAIPYQVQGRDCDNGSEFINREVINWASSVDVFLIYPRPYVVLNRRLPGFRTSRIRARISLFASSWQKGLTDRLQ